MNARIGGTVDSIRRRPGIPTPAAAGRAALAATLALACGSAAAEKLVMPAGMGGVPDIGHIPCVVFNEMMVVAPLGTQHSLLTWAAGYLKGATGKSLQELADAVPPAGEPWTYERMAGGLVAFCASNPQATTDAAAADLARALGGG
jgi:hypothetical protein